MSRIKHYLILIIIVLSICPSYATTLKAADQESVKKTVHAGKNLVLAAENRNSFQPVLAITPREVDVGTISPGEVITGVFTFTNMNMGSGVLDWSTSGPEGWRKLENQKLSNTQEYETDSLRFEIRLPVDGDQLESYKLKASYNTEIQIEAGRGKLICQKDLPIGIHKEVIKITSSGGSRTIYVTFKIVASQESPMINFNPARLDMGCVIPGKIVSKKIIVTNKGKEMLIWAVTARKSGRNEDTSIFKKERYISFLNEEVRESGNYSVPGHLRDAVELYGKWTENDGYPYSIGGGSSIKYRFNGTGISLDLAAQSEEGSLDIYLDENILNSHKWSAKKEKGELVIAEGLADGPHVVTVVKKEGNLKLEGVKITGKDVIRGPAGWMTVWPNSGTTTSQSNYLNVTLNTGQLAPGYYGDNIVFKTNSGEETVEVYVEVMQDNVSRVIDIYRYSKGLDYLFTANPQMETKMLSQNSYVKDGIAFRLFMPETPGTKSFYRWYSPQIKDHFYHHDSKGGGKNLQGYVFEGTIGNIATSKMTNTRELYRWVNTSTGNHFYSTDSRGENVAKNGYRFEGIAGYVK